MEFLNSDVDLDDVDGWRPVRPLGEGGYGLVGLWQKFDDNNTVVDSIAIKQQKYYREAQHHQNMSLGFNGLSREAALMHQVNFGSNRNVIRLRGFRNNKPERLWRYYFEFAPWDDLRILKNKYSA